MIKSKAKINLFLHITAYKPNFHELESVFCFANDLFDEISIEKIAPPFKEIYVTPSSLEIRDNLIIRIAEEFEKCLGETIGFKCHLKKNIPVSAGLAGGSGNAAAALKLMQQIWDFPLNDKDIRSICEKVGSDTYLCYREKSCFLKNETIQDIEIPKNFYLLIFNNGEAISTKKAFQDWSGKFTPKIAKPFNSSSLDFIKHQHNDLEKVAQQFFDLNSILSNIENQPACQFARMSGSGSSCFGVFQDLQQAERAKTLLLETYPESKIWVSSVC